MWMLTPKACDTFDALVVLCRSGWGVEAGVLFRVLMETAATAVLANRFPEPFLFLYVESMAKGFRDYLLALKCIERREGGLSPARQERKAETEQNLREVSPLLEGVLGLPPRSDCFAWWQEGKRKGRRRYWNDISVQERMQQAGLGDMYDMDYRLISTAVHSTASIQGVYLGAGPHLVASFGPKSDWVDTVLPKACHHLLLHLLVVNATFEMDTKPLIDAQRERLKLLGGPRGRQ